MGTRNARTSKNIAHTIPYNHYEKNVLSGGILRSFKEVRWSNGNFLNWVCTFEIKSLVDIKIIRFEMNNVIHISREGGSYN